MNERAIFDAALEIQDPAQRRAFLDKACGEDSELRARIEALLAAHEGVGSFLDLPAIEQVQPGTSSPIDRTTDFSPQTRGEEDGDEDDIRSIVLSFLQPSQKPGSIGTLGHYEVLKILGQGGFGVVLKAFDEKLHRHVAIKMMNPRLAATSPPRKRFLREARAAAAIRHENIVQVYSVEEQPLPYLVMEYISGGTLQQKLDAKGPLTTTEVLHLGRQIAAGLAAAHASGLIHRDIKPGNILIEEGAEQKVKITDFGMARAADDASMTRSGVVSGTPMYMAPEQAQGQTLDHRADLFSLGSVLYQMACGRPPFRATTAIAVLRRVVEDTPRPLQEILPEIPDWLVAIVSKLHAKKPEERFQSAKEVADLLARCQSELQLRGNVESLGDMLPKIPQLSLVAKELAEHERLNTEEKPAPALKHQPRTRRSRRWATAMAAMVLLLVGLSLTEATGVTNFRGTVIRLFSPDGTLVVEVDDPGVSVSIDGEEMVITGAGAKEIRLKPGQYKVLASKDGKVVSQELVTVTKNGRQVVRVSREAEPVALAPTPAKLDRRPQFRTGGDWRIEGNELVQAASENARLFFGDEAWTDYDFEVEAQSNGKTKDGHGICLAFRAKDTGNFLDIEVGGWSATVTEAIYFKDGKWGRSPGCFLKIPHEHGRWYKVKIEARGPRIRCSVDGKNLLAYKDETLLNGMIGVGTGNSPVRWRNLKVTSPNGRILWEGFPDLDAGPSKSIGDNPPRYKNSLGMEFALVPKGKAWLGGGGGKPGDKEIEFKDDFYLGVYEVTQEEWEKVVGANPSHFSRQGKGAQVVQGIPDASLRRFPVESVTRDDCQRFITRLNEQVKDDGWRYRLPTRDEWEYTCRGGPMRDLAHSGYDYYLGQPKLQLAATDANFKDSDVKRPREVGAYKLNALGLHDMHGNVAEWCSDPWLTDPQSGMFVSGGYPNTAGDCSSVYRYASPRNIPYAHVGLRVARVRVESNQPAAQAFTPNLPAPSATLQALCRDQISPAALAFAGGGDAKNAPASLVAVLGEPMPVHTAPVSLAFSPDGRWLASASFDATILLRDAATGSVRRALQGHTNGVGYVAFTPDSQMLVSGSVDGTIRIWSIGDDVEDRPAPKVLEPNLGQVRMALSPDGRFLAACGSRSDDIKLWTWDQWDTPRTLTLPFQPTCLAFSLDGKLLACGGDNKHQDNPASIHIFSTSDGQPQAALAAHQKAARSLAFVPGGKLLVSAGNDTTYVWDLDSGKPVSDLKFASSPLAISPDGKTVALNKLGNVLLFDAPSGTRLGGTESLWSGAGMINSLAFSSDGKILAVGDQFGAVNLYDTAGWQIRTVGRELGHRNRVVGVAPNPDGQTVLSVGLDRTLRRWDLEHPGTNKVLENDVTGNNNRLIISPDGETFVRWPDLAVWDAATGDKRFTLGGSHCVAYSPDGKTIASTTFPDNTVRIWDVRTGREIHRFPAVKNSIAHTLAFSGDGKLLAAVANHGTVVVWNVTTGAEVKSWQDSRILQLAFHPTRELLAMGHDNGSLSLWNPLTGEKIRTWPGHTGAVSWMKFTPDGQALITSGSDGTIRLWDLENPRARDVIALGPANHSLVCELDASGKYLFAIGDSTGIFVLRLPGEVGGPTAAADPDRRAAEYVLSVGGTVRVNDQELDYRLATDLPREPFRLTTVTCFGYNPRISAAGLANFEGCKNLTHLTLCVPGEVTDLTMAHFKDCKNLTRLHLDASGVTSVGLANFGECKQLRELHLVRVRVADAGMAQFKNCTQLTHLTLSRDLKVGDAGLAFFKDCKTLTVLDLSWLPVRGPGLSNFKDCKDLQELYLPRTWITDDGLAHFKDCKNLTRLVLDHTKVGDAGLVYFKDCKKLAFLDLGVTQVTDQGLALFKDCKHLTDLRLNTTQVTDAGLESLTELKMLQMVNLRNTKVTADGVKKLTAALPQCKIEWDGGVIEPTAAADPDRRAAEWVLSIGGTVVIDHPRVRTVSDSAELPAGLWAVTEINLHGKPVTDAMLTELAGLKKLQTLGLWETQVTDAGLKELAELNSLKTLNLRDTQLTELKGLSALTNLESLDLGYTSVADAGLKELAGMKSLQSVTLVGTKVTGAGMKELAGLNDLRSLILQGTRVSDEGVKELAGLKKLRWLSLYATPVTDEGVKHLAGLKDLETLDLARTQVTDTGLKHLADLKNLRTLSLVGTSVTDAGLADLGQMAGLTRVSLLATKVTADGIKKLSVALPKCKIEWDAGVIEPKVAAVPVVPPPSAALEALRRD
ncbi:MAG: protein kinase, partial [Planctomycetales bacterium]|nr:protein kinase [Planctomycetales bacterium]